MIPLHRQPLKASEVHFMEAQHSNQNQFRLYIRASWLSGHVSHLGACPCCSSPQVLRISPPCWHLIESSSLQNKIFGSCTYGQNCCYGEAWSTLASASVNLGGDLVDSHRVLCSSKHLLSACRAKGMTLDIRFRVSKPCGNLQISPSPVASCSTTWANREKYFKRTQDILQLRPEQRVPNNLPDLGMTHHPRSYSSLSISKLSRQRILSGVRAQVPGDLSLVSETVTEVIAQEKLPLKEGFLEGAGLEDEVVSGYGWKVRNASSFDTEDLRAVAHIQASSFHLQAAVFDDLFFKLFKAEVLSALIYKARQSPPDRYACLLAEPDIKVEQEGVEEQPKLNVVGAVNLTALVDSEVLRHLHCAHEYLYVSGMAVDVNYRRQSVATLLLKACDMRAMQWGFDYLVLHAYEDDTAARTLYSRAGYRVIALDPMWMSTWVGRKRRVLMAKRTLRTTTSY